MATYGDKALCGDLGAWTRLGEGGQRDKSHSMQGPYPGLPSSPHVLLVPVYAWERGHFSRRFRLPSTLTDAFAAVLTFKGLDQLRGWAECGRRVPVPLRKHKTIKKEQWSLLPFTQNTKCHQNVAELQAALLGQLSRPLA